MAKQLITKLTSRTIACACICGLLFSFIIQFGYQLEYRSSIQFDGKTCLLLIVWFLLFSILFTFLFSISADTIRHKFRVPSAVCPQNTLRLFFIVFSLFFAVWMIYALALYPGIWSYDAPWQWSMYANNQISDHHPVLHTLLIGWCMQLGLDLTGTYIKGAFLYTLVQIMFTDICISFFICWLCKKNASKRVLFITFTFFLLAPTFILNLLSATKDSWFAPSILVFCILTIDMLATPDLFFSSKPMMCGWLVSLWIATVMRNNALYPVVIFLIALLWINRNHIRTYLVLTIIFAVIFILYKGPISNSFITAESDKEEFLSVPVQQIMWVYSHESLTDSQRADIETLFSEHWDIAEAYYNPKIADAPKTALNMTELSLHRDKYISLYFSLGRRYIADYINAFLMNTYCLWYPEGTQVLTQYGYEAYMICNSTAPVENSSKIPILHRLLSSFETGDFVVHNSVTKWIFSMGSFFCFFLFTFFLCIVKSNKPAWITLGFILLYWCTFLLGPCALVRYVSFLFYLFPLHLYLISATYCDC